MRTGMFLRLILAFPLLSATLVAQGSRIVDEGSFTITVGGRTVGRENFRITAASRGDATEYVAKADVAYGDRKVSPELTTDANGAAVSYAVTRTGDESEKWIGLISRGRVSANITTAKGPAAQEFMVPAGAVLLDDDLLHQYFFVARRTHSGRVAVIVPRRNDVTAVTVTESGTGPLQVGTKEVQATRLHMDEPGADARDVWVDAAGRVLKVEIPAQRLVATRDDPPRD